METILFESTNKRCNPVSLKTALLTGLAPDKGLFIPVDIPFHNEEAFHQLSNLSYPELACTILHPFLVDYFTEQECLALTEKAYNFEIPIESLGNEKYLLRLDQGPTHSFKDFGARMMALLIERSVQDTPDKTIILTATSGDTGSAIGNAFHKMNNIEVVILFPKDEISTLQRKQMTTLGNNIHPIAIDGKFDDCQAMVKEAFADPNFNNFNLTSANSINIGRLLPQTVYYIYSFLHTRPGRFDPVIFSIPSGNFGNACGCLLAKKMGLPVSKMILATNSNDSFPRFLETGIYKKTEPSIPCISSAMNVGHPSNLSRMVMLYGGNMDETGKLNKDPDINLMRNDIYSVSVTEKETRDTIHKTYQESKLILEPHGAVGIAGMNNFLQDYQAKVTAGERIITLETAHPAKFPEEIREILSIEPDPPLSFAKLNDKDESYEFLDRRYQSFKEYLLDHK